MLSGGPAVGALPAELTSFVGRHAELEKAADLLAGTRLLTLTGPGGIGKTRLAVHLARRSASSYAGGVVFVDLSTAGGLEDVTQRVSTALEQRHRDGQTTLLLLDTCEHVVDACAHVLVDLLASSPRTSVLATSRQRIGIPGERLMVVPPLPVPPRDTLAPEAVRGYDSVHLLLERARALDAEFGVEPCRARDVAELCRRLDGNPLAVELVAARVRTLSPGQILHRLDDHEFALLTKGSRAVPARHRTLRAAVEWSYETCTSAERSMWSWLAVFAGDFTLESAERVCATDAGSSVLDLVSSLVDKSVVTATEEGAQVRYRLPAAVRRLGRMQLLAAGQEADLTRRHRDWFADVGVRAGSRWFRPDQRTVLADLRAQQPDLHAAFSTLVADGDATGAMRVATSLSFLWAATGQLEEGITWLSTALAADSTRADTRVRVGALLSLARLAACAGRREQARVAAERAVHEADGSACAMVRADGVRATALRAALAGDESSSTALLAAVADDEAALAADPESAVQDLRTAIVELAEGGRPGRRRPGGPRDRHLHPARRAVEPCTPDGPARVGRPPARRTGARLRLGAAESVGCSLLRRRRGCAGRSPAARGGGFRDRRARTLRPAAGGGRNARVVDGHRTWRSVQGSLRRRAAEGEAGRHHGSCGVPARHGPWWPADPRPGGAGRRSADGGAYRQVRQAIGPVPAHLQGERDRRAGRTRDDQPGDRRAPRDRPPHGGGPCTAHPRQARLQLAYEHRRLGGAGAAHGLLTTDASGHTAASGPRGVLRAVDDHDLDPGEPPVSQLDRVADAALRSPRPAGGPDRQQPDSRSAAWPTAVRTGRTLGSSRPTWMAARPSTSVCWCVGSARCPPGPHPATDRHGHAVAEGGIHRRSVGVGQHGRRAVQRQTHCAQLQHQPVQARRTSLPFPDRDRLERSPPVAGRVDRHITDGRLDPLRTGAVAVVRPAHRGPRVRPRFVR